MTREERIKAFTMRIDGHNWQEIAREIAELTPAQKHIVMDLVQSLRRHGTL